jgi:hypothetical protein
MPAPAFYDVPELSETDVDAFPAAPTLPKRRLGSAHYHYDKDTVLNPVQDELYEIPSDPMYDADSEFDSEISRFVIDTQKTRFTRVLYAKIILLSVVFGILGGIIGAQILAPLDVPARTPTQGPKAASVATTTGPETTRLETTVAPGTTTGAPGCSCSHGTIVFAYTGTNTDPCFAVADGSTTAAGLQTPNLLQKNGLFIRAGRGNEVGLVADASVDVAGVVATATSGARSFATVYSASGNGDEEGFYLTQSAMFGITGSAMGRRARVAVETNVTLLSDASETAPVSIRLLPLVCIGA